MTATDAPPQDATTLRQRADALYGEYRRHLESGCWCCSTGRWCSIESELDFQCDVAVRRAYGG